MEFRLAGYRRSHQLCVMENLENPTVDKIRCVMNLVFKTNGEKM
jgi:hypothetical protein